MKQSFNYKTSQNFSVSVVYNYNYELLGHGFSVWYISKI